MFAAEPDFATVQRTAEQGDAAAQNSLGRMYSAGRGVAKDERKAVEWRRKAAAQGNADAKKALAAMKEKHVRHKNVL